MPEPMIDDNEIVPVCMVTLLELEKVKDIVSEEVLTKGGVGGIVNDAVDIDVEYSIVLTVALPFTGVNDEFTLLTELGMPVKTKFIVSEVKVPLEPIVLLHVLLPKALFDKTTEFEA